MALLASTRVAAAPGKQELGVESLIYVGTHAAEGSDARGIYLFRMRTSDDPNIPEFVTVTPLGLVAETANPSFLAIDADRRLLFCVNETGEFEGRSIGAITSYSLDPESGRLALISQRSSMGAGPCHLVLDSAGKCLLIANDAGSVVAMPVADDGKLLEPTAVLQHIGKSVDPERQSRPHPRSITLSPDNRFAFVCDLGLDKIMAYRFDAATGALTPHERALHGHTPRRRPTPLGLPP